MNVPQEELNQWRRTAGLLRVTCRAAMKDMSSGNAAHARQLVESIEDTARLLGLRLEHAGAERPDSPPPSFTEDVPLHLLDTPTNRRYAEALRVAWEAGLEVDQERYGPTIGTDGCAQVIEMVLADVEEELHGPAGTTR